MAFQKQFIREVKISQQVDVIKSFMFQSALLQNA